MNNELKCPVCGFPLSWTVAANSELGYAKCQRGAYLGRGEISSTICSWRGKVQRNGDHSVFLLPDSKVSN